MITYESEKDLIYAYGEGAEHKRPAARQRPAGLGRHGQSPALPPTERFHGFPTTPPFNWSTRIPASGPWRRHVDPDIKKKKPPKKGFRIPSNNMERRGFSGQIDMMDSGRVVHDPVALQLYPLDRSIPPSTRGLAVQDSAQLCL